MNTRIRISTIKIIKEDSGLSPLCLVVKEGISRNLITVEGLMRFKINYDFTGLMHESKDARIYNPKIIERIKKDFLKHITELLYGNK